MVPSSPIWTLKFPDRSDHDPGNHQPLMILPPPDLKNFIAKTASFVRKNGKAFEDKIKEREKGNPKFTFLFSNDPYHPYYVSLLEDPFFSEKQDSKPESSTTNVSKPDQQMPQRSVFLTGPQEVSPLDLALMKLVAKYVLVNGQTFMLALFSRESNNHLFDFLKPLNSLNGIFKSLIEQYSTISNHAKTVIVPADAKKSFISQLCVKSSQKGTDEPVSGHHLPLTDRLINFDTFSLVDFFEVNVMASPTKPISLAEFTSLSNTHKITMWIDSAVRGNEPNTAYMICSICLSHVSADKYAEHVRNELFRPKAEHVLE